MIIAIAVVCTLCEAVFTALEVALGAVSRAHLKSLLENDASPAAAGEASGEATNKRRARRVLELLERPDRLTMVFITITSLTMWTAVALLTWQAMSAGWTWWMLLLALAGVLFVAEVVPLLIAARHTEAIALGGAGVARGVLLLLSPLVGVVGALGHGAARLLGASAPATPAVTEGELRSVLASAEEEGVIESEERALLESAMDFRDKVVREVMTPRVDMVGVAADAPVRAALRLALDKGHSRLPVYEESLDHVVGVIATKDLLPALRAGADADEMRAADAMRPPFFVPENKRIASTLEELRRQRSLLAIVVEPDGGTAGLVTLEDLLEEIVGEIQDEYDTEEPPLAVVENVAAKDAAVRGEASVTVRDLSRFWQRYCGGEIELQNREGQPAEPSRSLAALALQLFDGVPTAGDRTRAGFASGRDEESSAPLEMEILNMNGPRIEEVQIEVVRRDDMDEA
jgi:CBS domain containing-hemolysin-like protein